MRKWKSRRERGDFHFLIGSPVGDRLLGGIESTLNVIIKKLASLLPPTDKFPELFKNRREEVKKLIRNQIKDVLSSLSEPLTKLYYREGEEESIMPDLHVKVRSGQIVRVYVNTAGRLIFSWNPSPEAHGFNSYIKNKKEVESQLNPLIDEAIKMGSDKLSAINNINANKEPPNIDLDAEFKRKLDLMDTVLKNTDIEDEYMKKHGIDPCWPPPVCILMIHQKLFAGSTIIQLQKEIRS